MSTVMHNNLPSKTIFNLLNLTITKYEPKTGGLNNANNTIMDMQRHIQHLC